MVTVRVLNSYVRTKTSLDDISQKCNRKNSINRCDSNIGRDVTVGALLEVIEDAGLEALRS